MTFKEREQGSLGQEEFLLIQNSNKINTTNLMKKDRFEREFTMIHEKKRSIFKKSKHNEDNI
jgi:hypothetical protein